MKRLRIIIILLAVLFTGIFVIYLIQPKEPSYQDRKLSEWLADYSLARTPSAETGHDLVPNREATMKAAERAVKAIGTNAIPTLLKWLQAKDSPLKTKLQAALAKQHFIRVHFQRFEDKANLANWGFCILGNDALPAVPTLMRIMQSPDDRERRWALPCLFAFTEKQDIVLPLVLQSLHDSDRGVQWEAAFYLNDKFPDRRAEYGPFPLSCVIPESPIWPMIRMLNSTTNSTQLAPAAGK